MGVRSHFVWLSLLSLPLCLCCLLSPSLLLKKIVQSLEDGSEGTGSQTHARGQVSESLQSRTQSTGQTRTQNAGKKKHTGGNTVFSEMHALYARGKYNAVK